jgi:hypothetical protein
MVCINAKYTWGGPMGALLSFLLIFGCAGDKAVKKDSPFEKWSVMAETQTGRSPSPRDRSLSMTQEFLKGTGEAEES